WPPSTMTRVTTSTQKASTPKPTHGWKGTTLSEKHGKPNTPPPMHVGNRTRSRLPPLPRPTQKQRPQKAQPTAPPTPLQHLKQKAPSPLMKHSLHCVKNSPVTSI